MSHHYTSRAREQKRIWEKNNLTSSMRECINGGLCGRKKLASPSFSLSLRGFHKPQACITCTTTSIITKTRPRRPFTTKDVTVFQNGNDTHFFSTLSFEIHVKQWWHSLKTYFLGDAAHCEWRWADNACIKTGRPGSLKGTAFTKQPVYWSDYK